MNTCWIPLAIHSSHALKLGSGLEGAATKDGFVHFRVTFDKNHKPPFLALYNPATKQYTGRFGYLPDHKNHASHAGEMFGTFVFQMTDAKKY